MQWGWNHNPDSTKWSLTQRSGYLRLTTGKVVSSLLDAVNMLTQRLFANYDQSIPTVGTTRVEVGKMKDGDVAGLAMFQDPYAYVAVRQTKEFKQLIMVNNGETIASVPMKGGDTIYLRTAASNKTKKATFAYSYDNKKYTPIGNELNMAFSLKIFTGNKFGLFNYATKATDGYVDFDWFRVDFGLRP